MGWGRAEMSTAFMVTYFTSAAMYPVGPMLDRFGPKRVVVSGLLLFGLSVAALSTLNGSTLQLTILYGLAGALGVLPGSVAYARAISAQFTKRRGLMLGICLGVAGGLGAALTPPLAGWLIENFGWRNAYIVLGSLPVIIGRRPPYCSCRPAAQLAKQKMRRKSVALEPGSSWARPFVPGHSGPS